MNIMKIYNLYFIQKKQEKIILMIEIKKLKRIQQMKNHVKLNLLFQLKKMS